jgi:MFS family permease
MPQLTGKISRPRDPDANRKLFRSIGATERNLRARTAHPLNCANKLQTTIQPTTNTGKNHCCMNSGETVFGTALYSENAFPHYKPDPGGRRRFHHVSVETPLEVIAVCVDHSHGSTARRSGIAGRNARAGEHMPRPAPSINTKFGVHVDVLKLGLVSMLTDLSSEMIFSVFAVFFTTIAGASVAVLGLVEGFADFSASALDYVAGWLSDRTGRHKIFAAMGYGFSTMAKGILLLTSSVIGLSVFRIVERVGKSFRGPPRDAWLAAVAHKGARGYSFGVHKALDKSGAVVGPLVAYGLLSWLGNGASTYRTLFWVALVPAVLSVVVLCLIRDQPAAEHRREDMLATWNALNTDFKRYLVTAGIFSLAYFSFGFLLVRAHSAGFAAKEVVLLYALFNIAFVVSAPLIGRFSDRYGRARIIMIGYLTYLLMCLGFVFATAKWQFVVLFLIYGVFYSIDEAQSKAFIADIEADRRASAIGVYNFLTGLLYLPASLGAGALWVVSPASAFLVAAGLTVAAMAAFVILRPDVHHDSA